MSGMFRAATLAVCLIATASGVPFCSESSVQGEDEVFSGPQPGEKLTPFKVQGVFDAAAGKEYDPIAEAAGKPILLIFVHKITRPGLGLSRGLTSYAKSIKDPAPFAAIAWLDDDKAKAEAFLNRARKSLNWKVPVGICVDGGEGPGAYGLNRNVELTILIAKENKVVSNFALIQPSVSADGVKIATSLAKTLGVAAPTEEEFEKIAYPGRDMNMRMRNRQRTRDGAGGRERRPQPKSEAETGSDKSE